MQIKLVGVHKQFDHLNGPIEVLKGVDALFDRGISYAITGVSGSGKSTLLHIMAGLDEPSRGQILINNHSLHLMSAQHRNQFLLNQVGLVFQQPYLIKELSVIENVMLKGLIAGGNQVASRDKAMGLLARVGLTAKAESSIGALSGGQQQRVAMVRALFNRPAFLFADEPTGNLDEAAGHTVIDLLLECQAEWGMGIVIISHDPRIVQRMATIFHLNDGVLMQLPKIEHAIGNNQVLY